MGASCARRRPPLVAEGETPFWEALDRGPAPTQAPAETAPEEVAEKDEVELPGLENPGVDGRNPAPVDA